MFNVFNVFCSFSREMLTQPHNPQSPQKGMYENLGNIVMLRGTNNSLTHIVAKP